MITQKEKENNPKEGELFTPINLGSFELANRVVMAPLSRMRAGGSGVPNQLNLEYYLQRTSPGALIITESTGVSANGSTYYGAPQIMNDQQTAGWKKIVEAVHEKGGKIFIQLFHGMRMSHPSLQPDGGLPIGASDVPHENMVHTIDGWVTTNKNREATIEEIQAIVEDFREAAKRALTAGFDGVELHAAHGYGIDQFLLDGTNIRTDKYGGSIENRTRILLEITEALTSVFGAKRVAIRISPSGIFCGVSDSDPIKHFTYIAERLNRYDLAYLHVVEPRVKGVEDREDITDVIASKNLRKIYKGFIIANGGFDAEGANAIIKAGDADMVSFGRKFAANPDLVERLRKGYPLNQYDRSTFYGGTEIGYTDYPFYKE